MWEVSTDIVAGMVVMVSILVLTGMICWFGIPWLTRP